MSHLSVEISIWAKTAIINAVLVATYGIGSGQYFLALISLIFLAGGFVAALPLVLLSVPLLMISTRLTAYTVRARIAWLVFCHLVIIVLLHLFLAFVCKKGLFDEGASIHLFMGTTMISLLLSVLTSRKTLNALYQ